MFRKCAGVLLLVCGSPVLSQEHPPVTNLGLAVGEVQWTPSGKWLVLGASEPGQGKDLNGDGDTEDSVLHLYDAETRETMNLGLAGRLLEAAGDWLVLSVSEVEQGEDLNRDGNLGGDFYNSGSFNHDRVVHVHNLASGETTNLELAGSAQWVGEDRLLLRVSEIQEGADLNGDGEIGDRSEIIHVHNLDTGETTNLGLDGRLREAFGKWLTLSIKEGIEDLNGDGDRGDAFLYLHDLQSGQTVSLGAEFSSIHGIWLQYAVLESFADQDLNADGDRADAVLHLRNLETGDTVNLGLAGVDSSRGDRFWSGKWFVFSVSESDEGVDLSGDGDREDSVLHVHDLETGETTSLGLVGGVTVFSPLWRVFSVRESDRGEDLNGDGDREDSVLHVYNRETGETTNLGLAGGILVPGSLLDVAHEPARGVDLNGDGDMEDRGVPYVFNRETGETTNLGPLAFDGCSYRVSGNWHAFSPHESYTGRDLNGDGDQEDEVAHLFNSGTGEVVNLELSSCFYGFCYPELTEQWLAFLVPESEQGAQDLNGDGDSKDWNVIHLRDLDKGATVNLALAGLPNSLSEKWFVFTVDEQQQGVDLNGDGDTAGDDVLHVRNLETSETVNLRLDGFSRRGGLAGDRLAFSVREYRQGEDLNGDGDTEDHWVIHIADLTRVGELQPRFLRGDCDSDGDPCSGVNDALTFLSWLFRGDTRPPCIAACDADGNGETELTDAVYGLDYCLSGTAPPPAPFPECGPGTERDEALGCVKPSRACAASGN